MKPLFEFMIDPTHVEFEDDIVLALKTFIKKRHSVSPTLWTIFPHLVKVFEKSKNVFGNLLDTLNYYLIYGKEHIAQNRDCMAMLINIAKASMFCTQPNICCNNAEGAMLLQLLFQVFAGTTALNEYFEEVMNITMNRLTTEPMAPYLKRHLLSVFLTAMVYNPNFTL